jgi:hypothetical protein
MDNLLHFEIFGMALGMRELVVALILLVLAYMVLQLLRMRRLRHARAREALTLPPSALSRAVDSYASVAAVDTADAVPPPTDPIMVPGDELSWHNPVADFAKEAFMQGVERELEQLREETDALRGEVAALRDELRQEVTQMKATQNVSPLYSDAMQMAMLGHDAATVSERCGIARAEAELVVALAQSQNGQP